MAEPIRVRDLLHNAWLGLANQARLLGRRSPDWIVLRLQGSVQERAPRRRRPWPMSLLPWRTQPSSVEEFAGQLDRLAGDRRITGAVVLLSGLSAGAATLESLRAALLRFRNSGKRSVAYLNDIDMWCYFLACACDQVVIPESATFRAAGLWSETLFLKDTLALAGVEADFESIAEYKVTPDTLRRSEMTEPHRQMLESLLDSMYGRITAGVAEDRRLDPDEVQRAFDSVPLSAQEALSAGLVDAICYEDELAEMLGDLGSPAALEEWSQAHKKLTRPLRLHSRRFIGVVSVEGIIVPGDSRRLPVPVPLPLSPIQAGSNTVVQQLRAAAQDKRCAGVVLQVDSPGGSALASDLIAREVAQLARRKPVVALMGNQATSGGYYISAPADVIVAQPTTLTGSIGIWGGKLVTADLFAKARATREVVSRGRAAGLYSDSAPFDESERERIRADIGAGYVRFKARVAEGRGMNEQEVESLARGRVWTGEQALPRGLIDDLGGLHLAVEKARGLADIDPRRHVRLQAIQIPKRAQLLLPQPTEAGEWLQGLLVLAREGVWAMAPWGIRIRG